MKFICILFLLPTLAIAQITGKVVKVKDGDTVVVLDRDYEQHTIRIADIDCPERGQPYGTAAKKFTSSEIFSKQVYVKIKGTDRYGRTIGFVAYGDKDLSEELLKSGLAWHYTKYSNDTHLKEMEEEARTVRIGLWKEGSPIPPWEWRKRQN